MERNEDESGQREEAPATRMYRVSKKEDSVFRREAGVQALSAQQDTVRLQGHHEEGGAEDRLHGNAGQAVEAHGGSRHQAHTKGQPAFSGECREISG